jgi:hypothetical protein
MIWKNQETGDHLIDAVNQPTTRGGGWITIEFSMESQSFSEAID